VASSIWIAFEAVPVLIIEVASKSTRGPELGTKAQEYAALDTPEYWVVDFERWLLAVHRLRTGRYELTTIGSRRLDSSALPGFWILADWLWQNPLPPITSVSTASSARDPHLCRGC